MLSLSYSERLTSTMRVHEKIIKVVFKRSERYIGWNQLRDGNKKKLKTHYNGAERNKLRNIINERQKKCCTRHQHDCSFFISTKPAHANFLFFRKQIGVND